MKKLYEWGLILSQTCVICGRGVEDKQHLFSSCRKVRPIWEMLLHRIGYRRRPENTWMEELRWVHEESKGNSFKQDAMRLLSYAIFGAAATVSYSKELLSMKIVLIQRFGGRCNTSR